MIYNLLNPQELETAQQWLTSETLRGSLVEMKIKRPQRSLKANAYLHVLLGICGMEWGYSLAEMKTIWKRDIAPSIFVYFKNSHAFIRSSADLDSKELSDAIEQLKKYASENELELPEPHEEQKLRYYSNQIEKEKYL